MASRDTKVSSWVRDIFDSWFCWELSLAIPVYLSIIRIIRCPVFFLVEAFRSLPDGFFETTIWEHVWPQL